LICEVPFYNNKSVSEGIRALNTITRGKFNDYFIKKNKLGAKYRILINGRDFDCADREINEKNPEMINQSELIMKKSDLKTIDIVPLIESEGVKNLGIVTVILGALVIIAGIITSFYSGPTGTLIIMAGIGLVSGGVIALLSKPPAFNFAQNLDNSVSQSYLFNGPTNTVGEGNPVPVGYGTMIVGSNVISAGYKITEFQAQNSNNPHTPGQF